MEDIVIENSSTTDLRLKISWNPETGGKTFNVHVPGIGPICRLDVDGPPHRPAGRCHKHSLQSAADPGTNLPHGVVDRPELTGRGVRELFELFCGWAEIQHSGTFEAPDESEQ